jgi:hypothetical protein
MPDKPNLFARLSRAHNGAVIRAWYQLAQMVLFTGAMIFMAGNDQSLLKFAGAAIGLMIVVYICVTLLDGVLGSVFNLFSNERDEEDPMMAQVLDDVKRWRKERKDA